jgi:aminoglycoside phosphotransferase (APT) family kinase protein
MPDAPGPLLATGRAADVYDLGDGTVLRRYRFDHDSGPEAQAMRFLAAQGYPVPEVAAVDGADLVMERVDGSTMLEDLQARPWMVVAHARTLANLQLQLAAIPAPDWFRIAPEPVPPGDGIVHLDLHPMNVILSPHGPVVIDWTNAARGDGGFDAAYTYVLMATFEVGSRLDQVGQQIITRAFRSARGRDEVRRHLVAACELRLVDDGVTPGEARRVAALRDRARAR